MNEEIDFNQIFGWEMERVQRSQEYRFFPGEYARIPECRPQTSTSGGAGGNGDMSEIQQKLAQLIGQQLSNIYSGGLPPIERSPTPQPPKKILVIEFPDIDLD